MLFIAGVLVYEAITDASAFSHMPNVESVMAAAHGDAKYKWELEQEQQDRGAAAFGRSRVRDAVLQCLHRDPAQRPSAQKLVRAVDRIGNETMTTMPFPQVGAAGGAHAQQT